MAEGSVLIRSGRGKRAFAGEVSMPAGLGGNLADNQFFCLIAAEPPFPVVSGRLKCEDMFSDMIALSR